MYERTCKNCNKVLIYTTQRAFDKANKNDTTCRKCAPRKTLDLSNIRYCPSCNKKLIHTCKYAAHKYHKEKIKCKECARKNKNYDKDTLEKFSKRMSGKNNPMYGKKYYDIWVQKFGEKEANRKLLELKEKQSQDRRGNKNNMYGKPSPKGSGGGWSGWYNGFYFRSLLELSFILQNPTVKSAEHLIIEYELNNTKSTYRPDFLLENKIIEVKPTRLLNTELNKAKFAAGSIYAKSINMIYEVVSPELVSWEEIYELYDNGKLKFNEKWEVKFQSRKAN